MVDENNISTLAKRLGPFIKLMAQQMVPVTPYNHGDLTGLDNDDHSQYIHNTSARTIVAQHTFAPNSAMAPFLLGVNAQDQVVVGLKADQLNKSITAGNGLTGGGALTSNVSLSVLLPANSGLVVDASGVRIGSSIGSSLIPSATDTYDLGSSTKLWNKGWLSEIDAVLFSTNTATLLGGWFIVSKDAGTIAGDVGTADTSVDFGKAMTQNDFVLFRAVGQVEYMQVGTLVSGTRYNVTRNLNGGSHSWGSGTPFAVLGNNGTGRIEIYAYDTSGVSKPSISIFEQGTTYNSQTERLRLGDMYSAFGTGDYHRYGIGIGDYDGGNYVSYNAEVSGGLLIKAGGGNVILKSDGLSLYANYAAENQKIKWLNEALQSKAQIYAYVEPAQTTLHFDVAGDAFHPVEIDWTCNQTGYGIGSVITMALKMNAGLFLSASNPAAASLSIYGSLNLLNDSSQIKLGATGDAYLYRGWGNCLRTPSLLFLDGSVAVYSEGGSRYQVYQNSTFYIGYLYVPLTMPATSGNWNGGAKNNTTDRRIIDLSAEFGLPPGIKGVVARLEHADGTVGAYACLGPTSAYSACLVTVTQVSGRIMTCTAPVACDANGDIYFYDSEALDSVKIEIWGYFI